MRPAQSTVSEIAPAVILAALQCVRALAHEKQAGWSRPADFAVIGSIEIAYQEPDSLTHTRYYQLNVWQNRKAVLKATWEYTPSGPYKILSMRRGTWVDLVLNAAENAPEERG